MNPNTGGPAYPQPNHLIDTDRGREEARGWMADSGMTLLDWMAGQALVAIPHIGCGSDLEPKQIAHDAYNIASAMLTEKARRETPPTERISIGSDDKRKAFEAFKLVGSINHPEFDAVRLAIAKLTSRFEVEKEVA